MCFRKPKSRNQRSIVVTAARSALKSPPGIAARAKAAAAAWATTERAAARPAFSGRGTPSAALLAAKQKLHAFNELRGAFVLQHGLVQHFRFAEYLRLSLGRRLERLVGVHRTGAALALPLVALLLCTGLVLARYVRMRQRRRRSVQVPE